MFSVTYDYFTEDRTDILLAGSSRNIPPYFGAVPPSDNLGRVKSKGWELDMKFDKRTSNFHYWVNYAQGHVENRILEKDDPILYNAYEKQAGFAVNQIKTQQRAEMYTNWDMVYASVPTEST